jgi:hypothetical protein
MVVDRNKKMVVEYDWRDLPVRFSFYDQIPSAIGADDYGEWTIGDNTWTGTLYGYLRKLVEDGEIELLSQVAMLYDSEGRRVTKAFR